MSLSQDEKIRLKAKANSKKRKWLLFAILGVSAIAVAGYVAFSDPQSAPEQHTTQAPDLQPSQNNEAAREAFKQALTEFEQQYQPYLDDPHLQQWAGNQQHADKQALLASFARGEYASALSQLNNLSQQLDEIVADWDRAFTQQLDDAQRAFDQQRIKLAQIKLQQALAIKPDSVKAAALQARINAYAEVSDYVEEYHIGLAENNLKKQVAALTAALQTDPARDDLRPLLQNAQKQWQKQQLQQQLAVAEQALTDKNYASAQQAYTKAKQLDANNSAVKALASKLAAIRQNQSLNSRIAEVQKLADGDQWRQLANAAAQGLSRFPGNQQLSELQQQANVIIGHQRRLQGYIQRPQRLTDSGIRNNAKAALKNAIPSMTQSATLAANIKKLGELIKQMESTVELHITSDNRSHIEVKGVGKVGEIKAKTIALSPGNYTLIAKRKGYRNKTLNVSLVAGQTAPKVHLVCDEKI